MKEQLISIIIPCYNGGVFLKETLCSVFSQLNVSLEVILINDGSTDNTIEIASAFNDSRLRVVSQANSGVSVARNKGLELSKGEFIVFFDADDVMEADFLFSRLNILNENPAADYVCGKVIPFNKEGRSKTTQRGPTQEQFCEEILLYHPNVSTCPSSFLYRKSFLDKHKLKFNAKLSSTADRYFLLQCFSKGKLYYSDQVIPLLYRQSESSMSGQLTRKLVADNESYYKELMQSNLIPARLLKRSLFIGYWILGGANRHTGNYTSALKYTILSFTQSPISFMKRIFHKSST